MGRGPRAAKEEEKRPAAPTAESPPGADPPGRADGISGNRGARGLPDRGSLSEAPPCLQRDPGALRSFPVPAKAPAGEVRAGAELLHSRAGCQMNIATREILQQEKMNDLFIFRDMICFEKLY